MINAGVKAEHRMEERVRRQIMYSHCDYSLLGIYNLDAFGGSRIDTR